MKAYFVSDVHLGRQPLAKERTEVFCHFLNSLKGKASHLFLMGDIFDFWIEYRFCIPKHFVSVYTALQSLGGSGVNIYYIAGNHDFALDDFFRQFPNLSVHHKPLTIKIGGKFYHILHGDGMLPTDKIYRFYKKVIYSKLFLKCCRLLPCDWLFSWALWLASRAESERKYMCTQQKNNYQKQGLKWLDENPTWSAILHGHNHILTCVKTTNQIYISTGNWLKNQDYVILEEGIFAFKQFQFGAVFKNEI